MIDMKYHRGIKCPSRYWIKQVVFPGCTQRGRKVESLMASYYWSLTKRQTLDQGFYMWSHLIFTMASLSNSAPLAWRPLWLILIRDRLFFRILFCPSCNCLHAGGIPWILPLSNLIHLVAAASAVDKLQLIVHMKNWGARRIRLLFLSQDIRAQGVYLRRLQ